MAQLILGTVDSGTKPLLNTVQGLIETANAHLNANPSLPGHGNITVNISTTDPRNGKPATYEGLFNGGQLYLNPSKLNILGEIGGVIGHELAHLKYPNNVSNPTTVEADGFREKIGLHDYMDSQLGRGGHGFGRLFVGMVAGQVHGLSLTGLNSATIMTAVFLETRSRKIFFPCDFA